MGLSNSVTGAGLGFATYEALTVAYRNRVGHTPTPGERGALAGIARNNGCKVCSEHRDRWEEYT